MEGLLILIVVIAGLATLFGQRPAKLLVKLYLWVLIGPIFISLAFSQLIDYYHTLPIMVQALCWIVFPFAVLILLRVILPKSVWVNVLFQLLWELMVFVATFPFRFIWRTLRLITDREHPSVNLIRHYAAVGRRPPQEPQRHFEGGYRT